MWVFLMRELREQARGRSLVWLRVLGAASILGVFLWCWWRLRVGTGSSGIGLFGLLSRFSVGLIWLIGPILTADCIARERREGTLGLLWLTPLRPWQVVFAKTLAHGLRAGVAMAAAIPVFTIPLLLGGVGGADVVRLILLQISALGLAMVAGLASSAVATGWWKVRILAAILNGAFLGIFVGAYHLIWVLPQWWNGRNLAKAPTFWAVLERRIEMWTWQTKMAWVGVERGWIPTYTPVSWTVAGKSAALALGLVLLAAGVALTAAEGLRWTIRRHAQGREQTGSRFRWVGRARLLRWGVAGAGAVYLLGALVDWPTVDHVRAVGPIAVQLLFLATVVWGATRFHEAGDGRIWEMLGVVPGGVAGWIRREAWQGLRVFVVGGGLMVVAAQGIGVVATMGAGAGRYPWWLKWQLAATGTEALVPIWAALWLAMAVRMRLQRPEWSVAGVVGVWALLTFVVTPLLRDATRPWVAGWGGTLTEPWVQRRQGAVLIGSAGIAWTGVQATWFALGFGARWWLLQRLRPDGDTSRIRPGSQPRPDRKSVGRVYSST
jgi:ABC-type transport system involved in cytochrome c biogenesis permease component